MAALYSAWKPSHQVWWHTPTITKRVRLPQAEGQCGLHGELQAEEGYAVRPRTRELPGTDILYLLLPYEEPKYLYSYRCPLPGPFSARLSGNFQPLNLRPAKHRSWDKEGLKCSKQQLCLPTINIAVTCHQPRKSSWLTVLLVNSAVAHPQGHQWARKRHRGGDTCTSSLLVLRGPVLPSVSGGEGRCGATFLPAEGWTTQELKLYLKVFNRNLSFLKILKF